jgi:hypothetical protein
MASGNVERTLHCLTGQACDTTSLLDTSHNQLDLQSLFLSLPSSQVIYVFPIENSSNRERIYVFHFPISLNEANPHLWTLGHTAWIEPGKAPESQSAISMLPSL